jgi:hypothetical protein
MTDIMTVARVPGVPGGGYMDRGRLTRDEIIKKTREMAASEVDRWSRVLATPNADFDVRVVRGVFKQKLVEKL